VLSSVFGIEGNIFSTHLLYRLRWRGSSIGYRSQ